VNAGSDPHVGAGTSGVRLEGLSGRCKMNATRERMSMAVLLFVICAAALFAQESRAPAPVPAALPAVGADGLLRVRGLVVVDENGIERVRIEAPIIAPMLFGKRYARHGDMAGILLFDGDGNERSGYCTTNDGNGVLFTLDTLGGDAAHFEAYAAGGVKLWMQEPPGNRITLGVDATGAAIEMQKAGRPVAQLPAPAEDGK